MPSVTSEVIKNAASARLPPTPAAQPPVPGEEQNARRPAPEDRTGEGAKEEEERVDEKGDDCEPEDPPVEALVRRQRGPSETSLGQALNSAPLRRRIRPRRPTTPMLACGTCRGTTRRRDCGIRAGERKRGNGNARGEARTDRLLAARFSAKRRDARASRASGSPPRRHRRASPRFRRGSATDATRHGVSRKDDEQARGSPGMLPGACSVICLSYPYSASGPVAPDGSRIARYAVGQDYHWTVRQRAGAVARRAADRIGPFGFRVCVDSAPLAERSFAAAAGVGWIGKNGCLIDPEHGSFLLLAEIVTDLDLPPDEPVAERAAPACGALRVPTGAFSSRDCWSSRASLTGPSSNRRGSHPGLDQEEVGDNVFGCDICQEVCPGTRRCSRNAPPAQPTCQRAPNGSASGGPWRRASEGTPLALAGRRGVQRNAAVSAGAAGDRSACRPSRRPAAHGRETRRRVRWHGATQQLPFELER